MFRSALLAAAFALIPAVAVGLEIGDTGELERGHVRCRSADIYLQAVFVTDTE